MSIRFYFTPQSLQCLTVRQLAVISPRKSKEEMIELLANGNVRITSEDLLANPALFNAFLRGAFVRIGPNGPLYLIRSEEDVAPNSRLARLCAGYCTVVGYVERGIRAQRFEGSPAERRVLKRVCAGGLLPAPPVLSGEGTVQPVGQQLIRERIRARPLEQQMAAQSSAQRLVGRAGQAGPPLIPPRPIYVPPVNPVPPFRM